MAARKRIFVSVDDLLEVKFQLEAVGERKLSGTFRWRFHDITHKYVLSSTQFSAQQRNI